MNSHVNFSPNPILDFCLPVKFKFVYLNSFSTFLLFSFSPSSFLISPQTTDSFQVQSIARARAKPGPQNSIPMSHAGGRYPRSWHHYLLPSRRGRGSQVEVGPDFGYSAMWWSCTGFSSICPISLLNLLGLLLTSDSVTIIDCRKMVTSRFSGIVTDLNNFLTCILNPLC